MMLGVIEAELVVESEPLEVLGVLVLVVAEIDSDDVEPSAKEADTSGGIMLELAAVGEAHFVFPQKVNKTRTTTCCNATFISQCS